MISSLRVVVDTHVLISRLLAPNSLPARAVSHSVTQGQLLASDATLKELTEVLGRAKFDRYLTLDERQQFIRLLVRIVGRLLFVVHLLFEDEGIRLISARKATREERRFYEDC